MSDGFPLDPTESLQAARDLVTERFSDAEAAWLAGSVPQGRASASSDLDVVVLLPGLPAPFRQSLVLAHRTHRIPVELFVHTAESVRHYVRADRRRSQPTMARMVSEGAALWPVPAAVSPLVEHCRADVSRGPDPLSSKEIDAARYAVTDLAEDLRGACADAERAVVAATVWEASARLLLASDRAWQGTGKGLLRALQDRDARAGDRLGEGLTSGLLQATADPDVLHRAVIAVLDRVGGPLFEGYRVGGATD